MHVDRLPTDRLSSLLCYSLSTNTAQTSHCTNARLSGTYVRACHNGDPVSWQSKKQPTVALSTCESELYAECMGTQEILWLSGLMNEIRIKSLQPVLYGDNQSAIACAQNGVRSERTKHIDIKYNFITDVIERGQLRMQWIPTDQQQADILTKALNAPQFRILRRKIMSE